ncbi:hypothetical protein FRB91_001050 [Serendipita sp. 411]|nr:hypothetical protein FRB91_001050 [Serendipita sp. 411]
MSTSKAASIAATASRVRGPRRSAERLQHILDWLKRSPQPVLPNIRGLSLTYAIRNEHFGARHFAKEELPRISYANQHISVYVDRKHITEESEKVDPVMNVTLRMNTTFFS